MNTISFDELDLIQPILKSLQEEGYTHPTPIQQRTIPLLLEQRDVLGCAQTGTGKTAAFAIPVLQNLYNNQNGKKGPRPIRALILTPTRELAIQIDESLAAYGRHLPLRKTVIFGGVGQNPQVAALKRGVDIVTATPGRLLDLMEQGFVRLDKINMFVLDEADRMLDMGFINDVKRIVKKIPEKRQTLLFSATMPEQIAKLSQTLLHDPARVEVVPQSTAAETVTQALHFVDKKNKSKLLIHLLEDPDMIQVLVFTRTKRGANQLVKALDSAGIDAAAIHGNKSQTARQKALQQFKDGAITVLAATDIAARGIDIDSLQLVVNHDLPNEPETYVHRIGRTGRAGTSGKAISFCEIEEKNQLKDIEKLIGQKIPVVTGHLFENASIATSDAPPKKKKGGGQRSRPARGAQKQGAHKRAGETGSRKKKTGPNGGNKHRGQGGQKRTASSSAQGAKRNSEGGKGTAGSGTPRNSQGRSENGNSSSASSNKKKRYRGPFKRSGGPKGNSGRSQTRSGS